MFSKTLQVFQENQNNLFQLFNHLPDFIKDHSRNVADIAAQIFTLVKEKEPCEETERYSAEEIHGIVLFHDIGYASIPHRFIISASVSPMEENLCQNHTIYGGKILELHRKNIIQDKAKQHLWALAAEISVSHHERWDGQGYPYGEITTAVPLLARITSIANAYDGLIHGIRRHHQTVPAKTAIQTLARGAGSKFDPHLVELILHHFHIAPHGRMHAR